jgi:hypothetical protein
MVYGKKYQLISSTKNDTTAIVELWEQAYIDDPIIYPVVGMNLQYLPKSDFVYESIIASQLDVIIDVTDNLEQMPDLTTLDDRKYLVKLFIDGTQEWSGFVLSDSVQFSYTTGRKQLSFNAIDGLGMLESMPFNPQVADTWINYDPVFLIYIIKKALLQIGVIQLNIHTICSYYSSNMTTRETDTAADLFTQAMMPLNNFLLDDGVTYQNALLVLSNLLKSIGCRLFQARNKWYIIAINEFANETVYFTEYNYDGVVQSSGTEDTHSVVQPFTGNTSGMYFVDNSQTKIFRKGYNNFNWSSPTNYAKNYVINANLKKLDGVGFPVNWSYATLGFTASVTLDVTTYNTKNIFVMNQGSVTTPRYAKIYATVPTVLQGDKIDFNCTIYSADLNTVRGRLELSVTAAGGSPQYWWSTIAGKSYWRATNTSLYEFQPVENTTANDVSFTTSPLPVSGQLAMSIVLDNTVGYSNVIKIGNFGITFNSPINTIKIDSLNTTDNQYSLTIESPYGYPVYSQDGIDRYYNNQALGTFYQYISAHYVACNGWFRYGKPTESFQGLIQLIFQQYINSFRRNLKNIDSTVFGIETSNGRYSAAKMLKFIDTDPAQINVSALSYMTGNSTINLVQSEIAATFLDISNAEIPGTITTVFDVISTPPVAYNIQIRNNSGDGFVNNVYSIYGTFYTITSGSFPLADGYEIFGIQTGWNVEIDVDIVASSSPMYVSLYINTVLQEQVLVPASASLATYKLNQSATYSFTSTDQVYIVYN